MPRKGLKNDYLQFQLSHHPGQAGQTYGSERTLWNRDDPQSGAGGSFFRKEKQNWLKVVEIRQPAAPRLLEKNLGAGEREAIALFLESTADLLILDDLAARQVARKLGIPFTGVVGVLLAAKREGIIDTVKDSLDEMIR
jgi:predicted nucleic acid-binding protein